MLSGAHIPCHHFQHSCTLSHVLISSECCLLFTAYCAVLCCIVSCHAKALSSILWLVSKQGILVLDCSSEKVLWLDALSPWHSGSACTVRGRDTRRGSHSNSSSLSAISTNGVRALQATKQSLGFITKTTQYASHESALYGPSTGAHTNGGTGSGTGSGASRSQKITASFTTAAAMIGTMSMPSLEDIASSTSIGATGVAANAKKLQSVTTDLVRSFSVRNTLSAFSTTSTSSSSSSMTPTATHRAATDYGPPPSPKLTPVKPHTQPVDDLLEHSQPLRTRSSSSFEQGHKNEGVFDSPTLRPDGHNDTQSTAADTASEILDFLDAVSGTLRMARAQLESSLLLSVEAQSEAAECVRSGLRNIAQSVVGVSVLDVLTSEVTAVSSHLLSSLLLSSHHIFSPLISQLFTSYLVLSLCWLWHLRYPTICFFSFSNLSFYSFNSFTFPSCLPFSTHFSLPFQL
jgi:hypothetical protein